MIMVFLCRSCNRLKMQVIQLKMHVIQHAAVRKTKHILWKKMGFGERDLSKRLSRPQEKGVFQVTEGRKVWVQNSVLRNGNGSRF